MKEASFDLIEMIIRWAPTDPSSLTIHVDAADVLGQVGAAAEVLQAQVPAARVRHRLGPGGGGAPLTVHHGGGGAPAGHRALQLHQGAADAEREPQYSYPGRKRKIHTTADANLFLVAVHEIR